MSEPVINDGVVKATIVKNATCTVHWATGPVNVCEEHAQQLVVFGRFLGAHVAVTKYEGNDMCINCVNAINK
jgi:hypothetical protein